MKKTRQFSSGALLCIAVAFGILAAVLRMQSIATAYDAAIGLFASGNGYTIALILVCFLFLFAAFVLCLRPVTDFPNRLKTPSLRVWVLGLPAIVSLIVSVYFDLESSGLMNGDGTIRYAQIVLCLFSLFTAYCAVRVIQALRIAPLTMRHGFFMVMPIFWASYWLLLDFSVHSANPVILVYFFDLLAIICGVLALYLSAGFFFGIVKNRQLLFISLSGVFFALLVLGSRALCALTLGSYPVEETDGGHIFRMLFILLYQAVLIVVTKDGFLPGVHKATRETEEPTDYTMPEDLLPENGEPDGGEETADLQTGEEDQ